MSMTSSPVSPHRSVDARGRALPMTEEEIRKRAEEAMRTLDEVAAMGDAEEQNATLDALIKGLDEDRLSDRKRFRSCDSSSSTPERSVGDA